MNIFWAVVRWMVFVAAIVGLVFVGFVLVLDYFVFRERERTQPLVFVADFPQARAEAVPLPVLSESDIFRFRDWRQEVVGSGEVLLRVVGDVAPVRVADIQLRKKGMAYAFSEVEDIFAQDDLTLVNLETPLVTNCLERSEGMVFCALPEFGGAMRDAGVDIVGVANNHSGNYGLSGLAETAQHLEESGLEKIEDGELIIVTVKDTVFGFVAVNGVTGKGVKRDLVREVLERAQLQVDIVIVTVHWGAEYTEQPRSAAGVAPDDPKELGKWFVEQGVDLVVGAHPHVVQGVEKYKEGFIAYSHGNFIFDQEWSRETKEGVIGNYVFSDKKLVDVYFTPVVIEDWVRPRFATEKEAQSILSRMTSASDL